MATEGNAAPGQVAGDNFLGMPRVEGGLREVRVPVRKLTTVREESGADSAPKTGELQEADFAEKPSGSVSSEDQVEAGDKAPSSPDKDEEDSATAYPVTYEYEDDDDTKEPIGCSMDNFQVYEMGREHYGLVGPTAQTGATLVCAMVDLVPGNADQFGIAPAWILKRKHVLVMGRGKDMHFIYATMDSAQYEDEDNDVAITT
jgi:hypothetical protein